MLLNKTAPFREYFLIQFYGEGGALELCSSIPGFLPAPCDQFNNTYGHLGVTSCSTPRYSCIRTVAVDGSQNDIYCRFRCFTEGHVEVPCPVTEPEGYGEYYDLIHDPYQTRNTMLQVADPSWYEERLASLEACAGQTQCNVVV